jgi:hypothetical protein
VAARAIDRAATRDKDHTVLRIHNRETRGAIAEMIAIVESRHHDASRGEKRLIRMCRRRVRGRGEIVGRRRHDRVHHQEGDVRRLHETAVICFRSRHRALHLGDIHRREEMIARDRHHGGVRDHLLGEREVRIDELEVTVLHGHRVAIALR